MLSMTVVVTQNTKDNKIFSIQKRKSGKKILQMWETEAKMAEKQYTLDGKIFPSKT